MTVYDIQNKSDFSSGVMVVINIPEEDLDRKALYTLQSEMPDFLVPFRYRSVDGQLEFTYQLGSRTKLQYRFGTRTPMEYIDFWAAILQPLLGCGDWFLKPDSFVLDTRYLYLNKDGKTVSYLYIPSKRMSCEEGALRSMVTELSQKNPVSDVDLENRVLRAIMQDFQPKAFLQLLREANPSPAPVYAPKAVPSAPQPAGPTPRAETPVYQPPVPAAKTPVTPAGGGHDPDGIFIRFPEKREIPQKKEKRSLFGKKKEISEEKTPKKKGLFGAKEPQKEILLGAAAAPAVQPKQNWGFSGGAQIVIPTPRESEVTEIEDDQSGAYFRLVSAAPLPGNIPVSIEAGGVFTIGRFDVSVGRKQSDFEFDKGTKAVSRHHAVIERGMDGTYSIIDLSSSAGTFVNGERLPPNIPFRLDRGCRVSFGTGGADYVWEG